MKVCVVIPTFNRHDIVPRAIRSVQASLGPTTCPFEILVVDDGSTDGTIDRLRAEFGAEIDASTVRILSDPRNLGVSGSKNAGYCAASGDWVVFLDSDDILLPEAGVALVQGLQHH